MKFIFASSFLATIALALSASADPAAKCAKSHASVSASATAHSALIKQVSDQVTAKPEQASEVVKQAIIQSKASAELVLQIVKAAVLAAPEQAEPIRKVALALAPDAEKEVEIMIASVLQGDQVAGESSEVVDTEPAKEKNASFEPEGISPEKNTVWLTNYGALVDGVLDANSLPSYIQDTAYSPNVNHNGGAVIRGGSTVIIRPTTETGP